MTGDIILMVTIIIIALLLIVYEFIYKSYYKDIRSKINNYKKDKNIFKFILLASMLLITICNILIGFFPLSFRFMIMTQFLLNIILLIRIIYELTIRDIRKDNLICALKDVLSDSIKIKDFFNILRENTTYSITSNDDLKIIGHTIINGKKSLQFRDYDITLIPKENIDDQLFFYIENYLNENLIIDQNLEEIENMEIEIIKPLSIHTRFGKQLYVNESDLPDKIIAVWFKLKNSFKLKIALLISVALIFIFFLIIAIADNLEIKWASSVAGEIIKYLFGSL